MNVNYKNVQIFPIKYNLLRKPVTSNASRNINYYKFFLPLNIKTKKLFFVNKKPIGRPSGYKKLLRSRSGIRIKYRYPKINYSFRQTFIYFIGGLVFIPFFNKVVSVLFLSTGAVTYITTTNKHYLFLFQQLKSSEIDILPLQKQTLLSYKNYKIRYFLATIEYLPKNKQICLIEQVPFTGIKYIRSSGVSGKLVKSDSRSGVGVVLLPSKQLKSISIYALGSEGHVLFSENKKYKNTKSGYYRLNSRRPVVRGVAMNPVDHPHGGRTKSIKLPRTPWGTVAKLK